MERREFMSLAIAIGLVPVIGDNGFPKRPYIHKHTESRRVTPIRNIGFSDQVSSLHVDPFFESDTLWSMTKDSELIHTRVRSTDENFAIGLVQYHFEHQLNGKPIRLMSHSRASTVYISTTKNGVGEVIDIANQDLSEYVQRFNESFS